MPKDNWYEEGRSELLKELADIINENESTDIAAKIVYSYLVTIGLIDYDTEKDVFYERYYGE